MRQTCLALVLTALCACESEGPTLEGNGKVHLTSPLIGARLELLDPDGDHVRSFDDSTRATGTFSFAIPAARAAGFRLAVTGGAHEGGPVASTLLLDVERFDPMRDVLYINAVTTMIARYRDRHPSASVADASIAVKRFLGIPRTSRAGFDVDNPRQTYFRHDLLLDEMRRRGQTLDTFVAALLDELDQGVATHRFARQTLTDASETVEKLAEKLAEDLADESFSWAFEAILDAAGLGANAEVLNELHEINHKLDELTHLVDEVLSEEKQTQAEIITTAALDAIANIKGQYAYLTWATEHAQLACLVNDMGQPTDSNCAAAAESLRNSVKARTQAILDSNTGVIQGFELLKTALVPSGTELGILVRWNNYLRATIPFYSSTVYPQLIQAQQLYEGVQLMATNLIIEAYKAQTPRDDASAAYYDQRFNTTLGAEGTLVSMQHGKPGVLVQNVSKLVWMQAPWSNIESDAFNFPAHGDYGKANTACTEWTSGLAGYTKWRLPTADELSSVCRGSPNSSCAAQGPSGVFNWLVAQGFERGPNDGSTRQRGFIVGNSAYYTSTISGSSGEYWMAIWDTGVDFACSIDNGDCLYGHKPTTYGAWCVTDEAIDEPAP